MFFKVFLVFSCLVLYTTSMPSLKRNQYHSTIEELKWVLNTSTVKCSRKYLQHISYVYREDPQKMCKEIPDKFCQIHEAMKNCTNTDHGTTEFRNLVDQVKGNVNCTLPSGYRIESKDFFKNLERYLGSLTTNC